MPASNELQDWFKRLPTFTRYWFGGTIVFSLLGRFGILNPHWLFIEWTYFIQYFHLWRPITALFYYPINPQTGFHFLIMLYFMYNYSLKLETGLFSGRSADYGFMLLFNWASIVVIALGMSHYVLLDQMVMSVLYVWCQVNKDVIVNFWFGTQFKAMYLPWVLWAFNMVISGGGTPELVGIIVGHLYFFLMFKYPQDFGGPSLLATPNFMYNLFPNARGGAGGYGQAPNQGEERPGGFRGHQWGAGHRLDG